VLADQAAKFFTADSLSSVTAAEPLDLQPCRMTLTAQQCLLITLQNIFTADSLSSGTAAEPL
jgi:hypothetical protein